MMHRFACLSKLHFKTFKVYCRWFVWNEELLKCVWYQEATLAEVSC